MKLYDNAFSPFARKVRLVLDYKGIPYEAFDALLPEARAHLAAANRRVEVPVLEDGEITVVNSADIVAYLEQRHPRPAVHPDDPALRVKARAWERRADGEIDAILHDASIWGWPILERHDTPPPGMLDAARADLEQVYDDLESALAPEGFLCGELSIADLALFPHLSAVAFLRMPFRADRHPKVCAWFERLKALPTCKEDVARLRTWTKAVRTEPVKASHIVWRGDRVEWLLAHGLHEWLFEEIRAGRAAWPRR